jgi:diguanylate cyclase (GGDEF)-like protein
VGRLLRETVREGDIPCRYGGEEFTLILPETGEDGALALAEAVRHAIRSMQVQFEGRLLPAVTASCGVSTMPGTAGDIDQLLDSADRALYEAKTAGRDRVQVARPS